MRFRPGLIRPPRFVGSQGIERRATWLELFYDLVFVVAVGQAATFLSEAYDPPGLLRFLLVFVPIWWAWIGQTFYLTRFDQDDVVHRVATMIQMFAVAALAVSTQEALGQTSDAFVLAYVAIRAVLIWEYARAGKHVPEARPLARSYGIGFSLAALLWLSSLAVPVEHRAWIWAGAIVIDILTPFAAGKWNAKFPPHVHHLPERMGLFTILVLGESILAVVLGLDKSALQPSAMVTAGLSWVAAFGFWWCYFDGIRAAEPRPLNSPQRVRAFRIWMYTHLPLTIGIVVVAIGCKHAISLKPGQLFPPIEVPILAAGVFVTMAALILIFETSPFPVSLRQVRAISKGHWWVTFVTLAALIPAGLFLPVLWPIAVLAGGWVAHVVLSCREINDLFRTNPAFDHPDAGELALHRENTTLT